MEFPDEAQSQKDAGDFPLCLLLFTLSAEGAHITDKLLAGFYKTPDRSSRPIRALPSGTSLEVPLRKKDGYSKIRLGDSSEGWVENQYINQDKPAKDSPAESGQQVAPLKPLLADIQVEVKQLKSQLEQARQQSANSSQERIQALEQALQTAEEARQNSLSTGNPQTAYIQPRAWHIPLLLIGFISGIVFKNYRIAKRYGGLRM
ncbi:TIGR04211 family SH3 domain-containing protein [Candidatus Vondammii sp. HM_W22]|uniref:TIGR04211 family SH3 domain-containing protein n=1 Tax=Candidatus Vondammii sp. HM_W22 TaxID=2687299 RepID=UPI001F12B167|nr:TIGR04211 family SH3 domain-containing protein [Candidatus Vondammii sp. HM_W22]